MAWNALTDAQVTAGAQLDQDLMKGGIKNNDDDQETRILALEAGAGVGSAGGIDSLALKNSNEKEGVNRPLPSAYSVVQSFTNESNLQIWLRKIYDASGDTTTMYLDHGLDTELETQNDFETIGDFTSGTNTPTLAADMTNFIEGTQSIKMSKAALTGSIDMWDAVSLGMLDRNFRVSFYHL